MSDETEVFSIADRKRQMAAKYNNRTSARKAQRKRLAGATDGRSLRSTGRVEQFNFRCTPGLHARATEAAAEAGISLAEWMENAVEASLAAQASGGKKS
jgi:hypothetical protein